MAVAITGLMSNLTGSLRNAARIGEYDRAAVLAKKQMDELQLVRTLPRWIPLEGVWPAELTGSVPVKWRAMVVPFDFPPGVGPNQPVLDRIELQVAWANRTFTIEGFRRGYLTPADAERLAAIGNR